MQKEELKYGGNYHGSLIRRLGNPQKKVFF